MKRLFTLVALMAMVLGANAKWSDQPIYTIDYSKQTGFPFYVMGYVPEFGNGCMTDFGAMYGYKTDDEMADFTGGSEVGTVTTAGGAVYHKVLLDAPAWHQYFIADGIPTEIDGKYKVIAKVKATAAVSINVNMGWSWSQDPASASVAIPDGDFQEVTWEYEGIGGAACNLVAQPGTCTETIEWLSLEVYAWEKEGQRPKEWLQDIVNGDAEKSWLEMQLDGITFDDMERNFKICAWGKERGVNMNENDGWDPFPATIEEENGNHFFVVHGKQATTEGDAAAWDNQFWIQSQHEWTAGTKIHLKFKYKASKAVKVATQTHKQKPSDYLHWAAIGDINFTEDWQDFDKTFTFEDAMNGGWSVAFQLNQNDKDAIDFYFDDLSWEYLKLDEGFFISGVNATVNPDYNDLDNAVQFEAEGGLLVAQFGKEGYVDQVMISTKRGDDAAYKGATLKPTSKVRKSDPEEWLDYEASVNARIDLPGLGVWKVVIDTEYNAMTFEMLEGTPYEEPDPVPVFTYTDELVLHAVERDFLTADSDGNSREPGGEIGNGQPWDSQFWIAADRDLKTDDVTVLKFQYKGSIAAHTSTQVHKVGDDGKPCTYLNWQAIGDVDFTEEWQDFETEFTVPSGDNGMRSIVFNMAEIKAACDYSIKNVQWYIKDASLEEGQTYENLISGASNFYMKEEATTAPYTGINNVIINTGKTTSAIYNLAGQKVNNNFKGIVVKDGKKFVNK